MGSLLRRTSSLAVLSMLALAVPARAQEKTTTVPKGFVNLYGGFASAGNTNLKIVNESSNQSPKYQYDVSNLEMKSSASGGLGVGAWFFQTPFSLGGSFTLDFFNTAIKSQTRPARLTFLSGGFAPATVNLIVSQRSMFQVVPGLNLIAGVPLKFVRPYVGAGPAVFLVTHNISFTDSAGNVTQTATATDTKIGYNAFAGVEAFISRRFSAFGEFKLSQVNGLKFKPFPITSPGYYNSYDRIVTRRFMVGASFHF